LSLARWDCRISVEDCEGRPTVGATREAHSGLVATRIRPNITPETSRLDKAACLLFRDAHPSNERPTTSFRPGCVAPLRRRIGPASMLCECQLLFFWAAVHGVDSGFDIPSFD